jgi:polysaccharide export outer membrane protein
VDVTVRVAKYGPVRILVLGHVDQPGAIYLEGSPTLLDVLSKSRRTVLGANGSQASLFPKRCAIFRGKDQAVWIDLKSIMDSGSAESDIRLRRNDVVFIPDDEVEQISVLGEVQRPGMVRLGAKTTLSEVLAQTGGLSPNAGSAKIEIIRPGSGTTQEVAFKDLLDTRKNIEVSLQRGDIVYVQRGGFANFAYFLQQISPASAMLMFGAAVK